MLSVFRTAIAQPLFTRGIRMSAIRLSYPLSKTGKPLQPYMRFSKEKRLELLKETPNLTVPDQGRELGRLWRELPEAERKKYLDEYFEAKQK